MKIKFSKEQKNQIIESISRGDDSSALNTILSQGNISYEDGLAFLNRMKGLMDKLNDSTSQSSNRNLNDIIDGSSKNTKVSLALTILIFIITLIITIIILFI